MISIKSGLQKVFNFSKKTVYKPVSPIIIEKVAVLARNSLKLPIKCNNIKECIMNLENKMKEVKLPDNEETLKLEADLERKISMVSFCLENCVSGISSSEITRHINDINNLILPFGRSKTGL